jgi:small subunit ribosomal protein S17
MVETTGNETKKTVRKKVLTGQVVSDKMEKTIVVTISSRQLDRLYKKYVSKTKKIKAHAGNNVHADKDLWEKGAHTGDTVRVVECRPLSKDKRWRLLEIVERAR